jgi:hypothetical protein
MQILSDNCILINTKKFPVLFITDNKDRSETKFKNELKKAIIKGIKKSTI